MKPTDVNPSVYINFNPKSKYQNIKIFLQKAMFQIGMKKFLCLKKIKTLCHGHMLLAMLTEKKLLERFTKKNCKKTNQKEFRVEK